MKRFDGRVAFVTGGGTGIGLACAGRIVDDGGSVVIAGRREDVLKSAANKLGPRATYVACDVGSDDSVLSAVEAVKQRHGALHLAVNSAGRGAAGSVLNGTVKDFTDVLNTNLTGVFRCLQAEAKLMKASGGGSIVNISSIAGTHTHHWMTAYCAAKAGLNMLTRCAADDLGMHNIRVNAVAPGLVVTDLSQGLWSDPASKDEYLSRMPVSRLGEGEDIANAVTWLLSDESSWVTGMVVASDGGHHLRQGPDLLPLFRRFMPEER
jgi:NAD(P)-dependent dehydrogenase (short-subunit alcohol dehydrogenase family)